MRTANEMLEAAKRYQAINPIAHTAAFEEIEKQLRADEEVYCAFTGSSCVRKNNSMLFFSAVAITNQRLLIGGQIKEWKSVRYTVQSFNIENINAFSHSFSIIGGDLIIDTLGDDIKVGMLSRDCIDKIITDAANALHEIKSSKESMTQQKASDADELVKFKGLLDAGIISEEEFNAKKKQILGL